MKGTEFDLGIALSGGGARGVAHIGVLKALEDHNIRPRILSGSSSGAFVGALYATGMDPLDILAAFKRIDLFKISNYAFRKPGLVSSLKFVPILNEYLPANTFKSLKIPLVICTTKLLAGESAYFSSGNHLMESILASVAVPGIFTPVKIGDELYVDGGVMDNLPADQIRSKCKFLMAIDVNHINPVEPGKIRHMLHVIERSAQLMINQNIKLQTSYDLLIRPEKTGDYSIFDMRSSRLDELYEIGYHAMEERLEFLKANLQGTILREVE